MNGFWLPPPRFSIQSCHSRHVVEGTDLCFLPKGIEQKLFQLVRELSLPNSFPAIFTLRPASPPQVADIMNRFLWYILT